MADEPRENEHSGAESASPEQRQQTAQQAEVTEFPEIPEAELQPPAADSTAAESTAAESTAAESTAAGAAAVEEPTAIEGEVVEGEADATAAESTAAESTAADPTQADPLEELKQALEAERARADENYDLALRTKAEMENLRKRSSAEVDKARKFALEKFATEIIAVRDSLEMGLDAASKEDADAASIREGTELTLKMLVSAMDKFAVEQVDPTGQPFDPELHQAMGMQQSADHAPNTVMMVMQKGYTLNGRLIRPAMVMVSKA